MNGKITKKSETKKKTFLINDKNGNKNKKKDKKCLKYKERKQKYHKCYNRA